MSKKKESFLQGIIYLMTSQIIIKIFGMIYSLYLTNKRGFGDEGNAIYMAGFQIYALLLGICAIGVPNTVSKIVSESIELGDFYSCNRILRVSLVIFSSIGFLFCLILYFYADFIANNILSISASSSILKILAPSIIFSTIESVYRGYFNGIKKISISARSVSLEQIVKTIFTIVFVELIGNKTNFDTELMADGAMIAASLATISSFLYSYINYKRIKFDFNIKVNQQTKKLKKIINELFSIMVPISLTTAFMIFSNNIDSITIVRILKSKIGEVEARKIYGIITSKVNLIVGLPLALNGAVSISLIPEISRNVIKQDQVRLKRNIKISVFITLIISLPVMLVTFLFSNQIMKFLYPNAPKGAELLHLASITIIFSCLTQNLSGILQGIGDSKTHLYAVVVGTVIKMILNFALISNENILEKGAVISSIISNIVIFLIMFKKFNDRFDVFNMRKTLKISKNITFFKNFKNTIKKRISTEK